MNFFNVTTFTKTFFFFKDTFNLCVSEYFAPTWFVLHGFLSFSYFSVCAFADREWQNINNCLFFFFVVVCAITPRTHFYTAITSLSFWVTDLMDHSPSIITQVTRDEEENATCREEGEFGKKFTELFKLRMTMSARDEAAVQTAAPRCHKCQREPPWSSFNTSSSSSLCTNSHALEWLCCKYFDFALSLKFEAGSPSGGVGHNHD